MTTFDPAKKPAGVTLSNSNLTAACSGNAAVLATDVVEEAEFFINSKTEVSVGVHDGTGAFDVLPGWVGGASVAYYMTGYVYFNGQIVGGGPAHAFGAGDKIRVKRIPASNTVEWYKNDSATPTTSYTSPNVADKVFMCVGSYDSGSCNVTANFGAAPAPTPAPSPSPAPSPTPAPPSDWRAAALIPGALVRVPPGIHNLTGTLNILDGQAWVFENVTFIHTGAGPAFRASAEGWTAEGTWRCTGTSAATLMLLVNSRAFRVSGMRATGFGCGLKIEDDKSLFGGPAQPTLWSRVDRGRFSDLTFLDCYDGIDLNAGAEYMLFSNTSAVKCQRGISVAGGNNQFYGGNVTDCGIGVRLLPSANNAHGGFHGMNINHCTDKAVYAESITNGETFNGCHFYGDSVTQGGVHVKNSLGVSFTGGEMDCAVLHEGTGATSLLHVTMTGGLFTATGNVVKHGCFWRDGTPA